MYLTRRENGFRFQRRISHNFEYILGRILIRIQLGLAETSEYVPRAWSAAYEVNQ